MAQLKNNNFNKDRDDVRQSRYSLMQANIDTWAAIIGIAGAILAWAQGCYDAWVQLMADAIREAGESSEAYQTYREKYQAAREYYQRAKDYLISIIGEYGDPDDKIKDAYGINVPTPMGHEKLADSVKVLADENAKLTAAMDDRVLPQGVVDQLVALNAEVRPAWDIANAAGKEKLSATHDKHIAFDEGTKRLRLIYDASVLLWGPDSLNLKDLGFVPESEIWTKNKPPAPQNLAFDEPSQTTSWTAVEGSEGTITYQLDARLTGASGDWTRIYDGADTSTTEAPSESGTYDLRVRAIEGENLGNWSGILSGQNFSNGGILPAPASNVYKCDIQTGELGNYFDAVPEAASYETQAKLDVTGTYATVYESKSTVAIYPPLGVGATWSRVRAIDSEGVPGDWSDEAKHDVPAALDLPDPITGTCAPNGDGTWHFDLAWPIVGSASGYFVIFNQHDGRDSLALTVYTNAFLDDVALADDVPQVEVTVLAVADDGSISVASKWFDL